MHSAVHAARLRQPGIIARASLTASLTPPSARACAPRIAPQKREALVDLPGSAQPKSKMTSAQKRRRKSLANRRVSFAPDAEMETVHFFVKVRAHATVGRLPRHPRMPPILLYTCVP